MSALSSVFWDRVSSVTGFRLGDIENLREPVHEDGTPNPSDKDVIETIELCDLSWCDRAVVDKLRADLQSYVVVLRNLKNENFARSQSRIHARNYVEDARYKTLRQREAAQRVTPAKIVSMFKKLVLDDAGVGSIGAADAFPALEELYVSRNAIECLECIPAELRILSACASGVRHIRLAQPHERLLFASLAANELSSLAFIDALPTLVVLDVSFNAIAGLEDVVTMLDSSPELTRVDLRGNPVCLEEGYRRRICSAVPHLQFLDGVSVSEADRVPPSRENPEVEGFTGVAQASLCVTAIKDFALALNTGDQEEGAAQVAPAKDAKGAKGKADPKGKGKGKGSAEEAVAASTFATKRTVVAAAEWCGATVKCDDVDAAVQAVSEADHAAESVVHAKGSKGSKDKKATVAAPVADAAQGEGASAEPKPVIKTTWSLGGSAMHLARGLVAPCIFNFVVEDTVTATSQTSPTGVIPSGSAVGTPNFEAPAAQKQQLPLGYVQLDFSSLATCCVATPSPSYEPTVLRAHASGKLVVDPVALAERRYAIDRLRESLAESVSDEERLERQLADAMRVPTPPVDEVPAASTNVKPGGKKSAAASPAGGKGAKAPAPAALSDEAIRLQEQVAQAKTATEEQQVQLAAAQRALAAHEACSGIELTALVTISCAGPDTLRPPEPEQDALAATTNVAPKDAKKGKK